MILCEGTIFAHAVYLKYAIVGTSTYLLPIPIFNLQWLLFNRLET